MAWFDDPRLRDIYNRGIAAGVSSEDCFVIRRKLVILLATRSHSSHWLAGAPFSAIEGRLGIKATGDWAITFEWIEEVGPFAMRLEPISRGI